MTIGNSLKIKGWMSEAELYWLAKCAAVNSTIMEVGSYYGRSARTLADNLSEYGRLYCVDPWNGPVYDDNSKFIYNVNGYVYSEFCKNLKEYIDVGKVVPLRGTLKDFDTLDVKFDMIFLDGDHRYPSIVDDIKRAINLVKPKGIISGHDYNWSGVHKAVNERFSNINTEETIWWTQKS